MLDGLEADLRSVSSELQKAAVYILPKTHITLETVQVLTPFHSHVLVLADKWISGKTSEAYDSLRELLSRQSGMPIIAMLQTMLSKWVYMKMLCDKYNQETPHAPGGKRELPLSELVKRVSAQVKSHPFVRGKRLEANFKRDKRKPNSQKSRIDSNGASGKDRTTSRKSRARTVDCLLSSSRSLPSGVYSICRFFA